VIDFENLPLLKVERLQDRKVKPVKALKALENILQDEIGLPHYGVTFRTTPSRVAK
jgi:hypothetical protein